MTDSQLCERDSNSQTPVSKTGRSPDGVPHSHGQLQATHTGFEPVISAVTGQRPLQAGPMGQKRPVGVEPTLPPWQGSRLPLHHGRKKLATELSKNKPEIAEATERSIAWKTTSCAVSESDSDYESTGWDSNPRHRITKAGSWPLDDQCL